MNSTVIHPKMHHSKNHFLMKKASFISLIIIILLLSSCKKEIPAETHQFLQGAWALEGFTDSFRKMHWWRDAFQATGDTIGFIYIDICHDNGKNLKKFFRDSLNYKKLDLTHKIPEAYEKALLPYHRDGYVYRLCFC